MSADVTVAYDSNDRTWLFKVTEEFHVPRKLRVV
jgi:hypothetical protein